MSTKKKNTKLTAIAICRTNRVYAAAKHHLNLQERRIQQHAVKQSVSIRRVLKIQGTMIDIDTLCELARDADILYLASPDRLTRSHAKYVKIVRMLNALGVEVRVADDTIDPISNELIEYFQSEHCYLVRSETQRRAKDNKRSCQNL